MKGSSLKNTKNGIALVGSAVACAALAFALGAGAVGTPAPAVADDGAQAGVTQLAQRSISVTATDSVEVAPDMAELTASISPQGQTAQEAKTAAADGLASLTASLEAAGIDASNIVSSQVSINARYDWSESVEKVVGYQADVTLTVKELTLDQAGTAISAAAAQDSTTVGGVRYYVSNYDELYQQALVEAMQASRAKADTLAQAAGAQLGEVLTVQEGYDSQAYRYAKTQGNEAVAYSSDSGAAEMAVADSSDIELNPGLIEIEATVNVTYGLE